MAYSRMNKIEISNYHWIKPGTPANAMHKFSAAAIRAFSKAPLNDIYWRCGQIGRLFDTHSIEIWKGIKKWLKLEDDSKRWQIERALDILYEFVEHYGVLPLIMTPK